MREPKRSAKSSANRLDRRGRNQYNTVAMTGRITLTIAVDKEVLDALAKVLKAVEGASVSSVFETALQGALKAPGRLKEELRRSKRKRRGPLPKWYLDRYPIVDPSV